MPIGNTLTDRPIVDNPPVGSQLPDAEIAHAVQPSLWDGVDLAQFDSTRADLLAGYRPGDRMLLASSLSNVSPTARLVAVALAYHGWNSWPSRERLAQLLRIPKQNVSRATRELTDAGIVRKYRRNRTSESVNYQFSGLPLLEADISQRKLDDSLNQFDSSWNQSETLTGIEPEEATVTQSDKSLVTRVRPPIVDNDDSCGYFGCPPGDHPCPMCGRTSSAGRD